MIAKEHYETDFMEKPSTARDENNEFLLDELNSGDWWRNMEKLKAEVTIYGILVRKIHNY